MVFLTGDVGDIIRHILVDEAHCTDTHVIADANAAADDAAVRTDINVVPKFNRFVVGLY